MSSSAAADPQITTAMLEDLIPLLGGDIGSVTPLAVRAVDCFERHKEQLGNVGAHETLVAAMGEMLAPTVVQRVGQAKSFDDAVLREVLALPQFKRPRVSSTSSELFNAASSVVQTLIRSRTNQVQFVEALLGLDEAIQGAGRMTPPSSIRARQESQHHPKLDWRVRRLATACPSGPSGLDDQAEERAHLVWLRVHGCAFARI